MAALAVGNEVLFASSISNVWSPTTKNRGSFVYDWEGPGDPTTGRSKIKSVLVATQAQLVDTIIPGANQRNGREANCAEPLAIHSYFVKHPETTDFHGKNARIVAWGRFGLLAPCRENPNYARYKNKWRYQEMLDFLGIRAIASLPSGVQPVDYNTSPTGTDRITIC